MLQRRLQLRELQPCGLPDTPARRLLASAKFNRFPIFSRNLAFRATHLDLGLFYGRWVVTILSQATGHANEEGALYNQSRAFKQYLDAHPV